MSMIAPEQRCSRFFPVLCLTVNILFSILLLSALSMAQMASPPSFSLLYQFKSGRDGSSPYSSLILDAQGNLYGTTMIDGAYSYGTVFKISPQGNETVLHSFTGTGGDGATPVAPLIMDAAGNLYGTTEYGGLYGYECGPNGCGTVFKISPAGKETVLYRFTGIPNVDGMNPEQGLVRDSNGNLYGTTAQGGIYMYGNGYGTVFKIDSMGKETVLHSFNPFAPPFDDGAFPLGGSLLRDSAGNLYGTTYFGGLGSFGTVFKVDATGLVSILYNFAGSADGAYPYGTLVRDTAENLYGVTNLGGAFGGGTVFRLDTNNGETILHSFGGSGDGAPPSGGLVGDRAGNLYGTTLQGVKSSFGAVFKLTSSGKETILHNFSGKDGNGPGWCVVRDSKGNLYGTTQYGGAYGGGVVYKVTPN
jgi:uncharacterized repeat protein (TIGR03803 family)